MKCTLLIISVLSSLNVLAQKIEPDLQFDIVDFNIKMEVASWLCDYDRVAWISSDSVMAASIRERQRLGSDWFCFEDENNQWHAVYGKYLNGVFDQVFHYEVDVVSGVATRTKVPIDTNLLHTYARALHTANVHFPSIRERGRVRFNQYLRREENGEMSVWIFPAFQPDYTAVFGGEFIYSISADGRKLLEDNSYYQGELKGFSTEGEPREIWLDYTELEKPTLGGVFFLWYYKPYFSKIYLETSSSVSTPVKREDGEWTWMHAEKDD